jgi:antitoxin YxxD
MSYDFLKRYVGFNDLKGTYFLPVKQEEIENAEKLLGKKFPSELQKFYQEIGTGILSCGEKYPEMYTDVYNDVLPPHAAVNFALGITEWEGQQNFIARDIVEEDLNPGDLPFFEIVDSCRFLIMKLNSDNPNAVWTISGIKIEDSFERFIWRLYYESPSFYDDIIEKHYADLEAKKQG